VWRGWGEWVKKNLKSFLPQDESNFQIHLPPGQKPDNAVTKRSQIIITLPKTQNKTKQNKKKKENNICIQQDIKTQKNFSTFLCPFVFSSYSFLFIGCKIILNIERLSDLFWSFTFNHGGNFCTSQIKQGFNVHVICGQNQLKQ